MSVIQPVRELLDPYRLRLGNPTTGIMFATEVNTPIDLKNIYARRRMQCSPPFLGWVGTVLGTMPKM